MIARDRILRKGTVLSCVGERGRFGRRERASRARSMAKMTAGAELGLCSLITLIQGRTSCCVVLLSENTTALIHRRRRSQF